MEEKILGFVAQRNKILEEIVHVNALAISKFKHLDAIDIKHFFLTRKYMIEALIESEDKIITYSMMDWATFSLDRSYRSEYLALSKEKDNYITTIINQDKALSLLVEKEVLAKIS